MLYNTKYIITACINLITQMNEFKFNWDNNMVNGTENKKDKPIDISSKKSLVFIKFILTKL